MPESSAKPEHPLDPTTWVDRHGDALYRYALARLRDPDTAEEVVQETFMAALRARQQYSGKGNVGAWLMGICKRKVIDQFRRRNRSDTASGGDLGPDPSEVLFDAKGNWKLDPQLSLNQPEAAMEREEFWAAFRGCLDGLSQRQAEVFSLRELDGLSSKETCKELEISTSNLWVLLHRARMQLTRCMNSYLERWGDR